MTPLGATAGPVVPGPAALGVGLLLGFGGGPGLRLGRGLFRGGRLADQPAAGLPRVTPGDQVAVAKPQALDVDDLALVDRDPAAPILRRRVADSQEQAHGDTSGSSGLAGRSTAGPAGPATIETATRRRS